MASAFVALGRFCFPPKLATTSYDLILSHSSSPKIFPPLNFNHLLRASSEGLPNELIEDSKFVPLNADDPTFGPPINELITNTSNVGGLSKQDSIGRTPNFDSCRQALLLLGFEVEEVAKLQQFLKELDGEFLELIFCTEDMITGSLWEAINTKQPNLEASKIAKSLPRICIMSGLTGEEMMMFIDAFPEAGLEPAVFAALVPNSANKPLQEVIEEIMGDHEMMSARPLG